MQGKRVMAVLTVPSPLVRADAEQRAQLLSRVRFAAREISEGLRARRGGERPRVGPAPPGEAPPREARSPSPAIDFTVILPACRNSAT